MITSNLDYSYGSNFDYPYSPIQKTFDLYKDDDKDDEQFEFEITDLIKDSDPVNINIGSEIFLEESSVKITAFDSIEKLMQLTFSEWAVRSPDQLNQKIEKFCEECIPPKKLIGNVGGFLEKHDLPEYSSVAVIGDIHGNDIRLDLTLKALQKEGFLDEEFHCKPGKYILFLGDYVDKGTNSLKVLELVITLKLQNKEHVFLLRGNHEDLATSKGNLERYAKFDPKYHDYMLNAANLSLLDDFYNTMPVSICLGQENNEEREYVLYSHALFHLYTDPSPLVTSKEKHASQWVLKTHSFSDRMQKLLSSDVSKSKREKKQKEAAQLLNIIREKMFIKFDDVYWLDVGKTFETGRISGRTSIDPETITAYLRTIGNTEAKVKEIIRGHQRGGIWTLKNEKGKVVTTTVDPSFISNEQLFLKINLAKKVKDYKRFIVKFPLHEDYKFALNNISVEIATHM